MDSPGVPTSQDGGAAGGQVVLSETTLQTLDTVIALTRSLRENVQRINRSLDRVLEQKVVVDSLIKAMVGYNSSSLAHTSM
jgi:hypothetical protein